MFHHGNISAHALFGAADVPANGLFNNRTFQHGEFLAWGIFGTRNFWHLNISAQGYFGTLQSNMDVSAQTFRHLCYCAKMSPCQNIQVLKCPCAEKSLCGKVHVPNSPWSQNVHVLKCICLWNVCAEMSLAKMCWNKPKPFFGPKPKMCLKNCNVQRVLRQ